MSLKKEKQTNKGKTKDVWVGELEKMIVSYTTAKHSLDKNLTQSAKTELVQIRGI